MRLLPCVLLLLGGCVGAQGAAEPPAREPPATPPHTSAVLKDAEAQSDLPSARALDARQDQGTVLWVLPGPRLVDEQVFGTARKPERTARVDRKAPEPLRELVTEFPWVIGLPMRDRGWPREGQPWVTHHAVPFSDVVATVDGSLQATLIDRVKGDGGGPADVTFDEAKVVAKFTDPSGRKYEVRWRKVVHPPVADWETGGGVALDTRLYGQTGNGTPLLPAVEVPGATWALVDVVAAGHRVATQQLAELAITQAMRDRRGRLGTSDTLPLSPNDALTGRPLQAHLVVWPIQLQAGVPTYAPLAIPWLGQDGLPQPWIHVVWADVEAEPAKIEPPKAKTPKPKARPAPPPPKPAAPAQPATPAVPALPPSNGLRYP